MSSPLYFANMLLTHDHPMGRSRGPTRKKGDWYHSISVFAYTNIIDLSIGGNVVPCKVIHFYGHTGSPVLKTFDTHIRCSKNHMGKKMYTISAWDESVAVVGDIRTLDGYQPGHGKSKLSINNIVRAAINKWGDEKIPYAHQRNESYNCVAFVDDILVWAATGNWNNRIEEMHEKHGLYI